MPNDVIANATAHVKQSSRDAIEYLRRIKREAEGAENLRRTLEEEREAVAEKFATLDKDFGKREAARIASEVRWQPSRRRPDAIPASGQPLRRS